MDTFTLTIELGNDAMQTGEDVADALILLARRIRGNDFSCGDRGRIMDTNGNSVGGWEVS